MYLLALCYYKLGDLTTAMSHSQDLVNRVPTSPGFLALLAMMLAKSLDIVGAFSAFKAALNSAPKMACLWYNIGILYEK